MDEQIDRKKNTQTDCFKQSHMQTHTERWTLKSHTLPPAQQETLQVLSLIYVCTGHSYAWHGFEPAASMSVMRNGTGAMCVCMCACACVCMHPSVRYSPSGKPVGGKQQKWLTWPG